MLLSKTKNLMNIMGSYKNMNIIVANRFSEGKS